MGRKKNGDKENVLCNVSPQVLIHKLLFSIKVKFKLLLNTIKHINFKSKVLTSEEDEFCRVCRKVLILIHADETILYF